MTTGRLRLANFSSFTGMAAPDRRRALQSVGEEAGAALEDSKGRDLLQISAGAAASATLNSNAIGVSGSGGKPNVDTPAALQAIGNNIKSNSFLWGGYFRVWANYAQITASNPATIKIGTMCQGCFQNDPAYGATLSGDVWLTVA